jgi:hypothetical protein
MLVTTSERLLRVGPTAVAIALVLVRLETRTK